MLGSLYAYLGGPVQRSQPSRSSVRAAVGGGGESRLPLGARNECSPLALIDLGVDVGGVN
jgi:hypothetical protein